MTVTMAVDHDQRILYVRAEGSISLSDIRIHLEQERSVGGLPYRELIDARGYRPAFTTADVRLIVSLIRRLGEKSLLGPTAIVVDSDFGYGMVRMIEIMVEDVCAIRPFRQQEEAEEWLAQFTEE